LRRITISINDVLLISNAVVACLLVYGFFIEELSSHPYIDGNTILLGLVLTLQTHVALIVERRKSDPFVLLMAYILIIFYALRIFTLLLYPVQGVFERYSYGPSDSNYALSYIILANMFLYAGFYRVKFRGINEINKYKVRNPRFGILMLFISFSYVMLLQIMPELNSWLINLIFNNFFNPNIILLVLAVYVVTFRKSISPIYMKIIIISAITLMVLQTLSFSRSGILTLANTLLILILALIANIRFSIKHVIIGSMLIPFFLYAAFNIYAISTTSRMNKGHSGGTLIEKIDLVSSSKEIVNNSSANGDYFIGRAFSRAGYFDYSSELIAHSEQYSEVFTIENYIKSIVDNILTPGFDVFDQPPMSRLLGYKYSGNWGDILRFGDGYHTDQFGLYGEFYNLFGYVSLLIIFFIAWLLKAAYSYEGRLHPFTISLKRVIILFTWYQLMVSFGVDSIILKLVLVIISYYIVSKLIVLRLR
jgi:hypothetical protein